jgi:hypothetical protein
MYKGISNWYYSVGHKPNVIKLKWIVHLLTLWWKKGNKSQLADSAVKQC